MLVAIAYGVSNLWALNKVGDVYQIGTAAELVEFAGIVNGGENGANAILTADIDMTGSSWTPIGTVDNRYVGTFDGQGFVIDNLNYDGGENAGIFGVVNGGAVIKNLIAGPNNVIKGTSKVGGFIGRSDGSGWVTLENCGQEGQVVATGANAAAIIGVVMNGGPATQITNCYNTGNISGGNESAILTGWFGGHGSVKVSGFWNTGVIENGVDGSNYLYRNNNGLNVWEKIYNINDNQSAAVIINDDLASGKFAFELNGNADAGIWLQNLEGAEKDAFPTFRSGHGKVYANGELNCDGSAKGSVSYSNTEGSTRDAHTYVDGFCSKCGEYQADFITAADGVYPIATGAELNWFAYTVNHVNGGANAQLVSDIDMTGLGYTPIGQDMHDFSGHFDGQGHRILNLDLSSNYGAYDNQALFGQAVGGAVIENVIIDASCKIQGKAFTAGILGHVWGDGVIVRNCGNEASIKGSAQNAAGIVGCSERVVTIENCYNTGEIEGSHENAGICAWMGSNSSVIKNCYSTAVIANGNGLWRKDEIAGANVYQMQGNQGTAFTAEQMGSGELAYLLNGSVNGGESFYQLIGTEDHPTPIAREGAKVYANGQLNCDGSPKEGTTVTYSNTEGSTQEPHNFVDGICSVCGNAYDATYMTANDEGFYEVADGKQLRWISFAERDNDAIKVLLTNDIDMQDIAFDGIGQNDDNQRFKGVIDGQFYVIKNLKMEAERQGLGLINVATGGAVVKNLTIDASCEFRGQSGTGAFIGAIRNGSGEVNIENCGNEATVTTTGVNAGGLVGCNYVGEIKVIVTNSYNAGTISSSNEAGGLSGWFGNDAEMHNVYNIGTVNNGESFGRGNNIQCNESSYDLVTEWPAMKNMTLEEVKDGTLLKNLSDAVWHQAFGDNAHPVLYRHYDYSEDFDQQLNAYDNSQVTLYRSTVANTWNTFTAPFALTAEQIADIFGEGTLVAELTGESEDIIRFTTTTAIEAGKPYLLKPVKALSSTEGIAVGTLTVIADAAQSEAVSTTSVYEFAGVYGPTAITKYDYFVADGNKLKRNTAGSSLKGLRAYFKDSRNHLPIDDDPIDNPDDLLGKGFSVDGDLTGIILTDGSLETLESVYTVGGQKLNNGSEGLPKGLYIVNGKKVVIK